LGSYLEAPLDKAILERWEVAPASTVPSLGLGGDVIITQKAAVDEVFDQRYGVGPHGQGSTDFLSRELAVVMQPVRDAYRAAHNGEWPTKQSQLLPFATTPEEQTALGKLLLREASSK